jgi:superfamily II DNA/RNA helicase
MKSESVPKWSVFLGAMHVGFRRLLFHERFSSQLLANVPRQFTQWTECQEKVFAVPRERNVLLHSYTGSGKTIAYLMPTIEEMISRTSDETVGIVIVPTRELARQVGGVSSSLMKGFYSVETNIVCGGDSLIANGANRLIVGTPGALINNLQLINANAVKSIVIDEVDRLLDYGFIGQLDTVLRYLSVAKPHVTVSSATFSRDVELICERILGSSFVRVESKTLLPPNLSHTILTYQPIQFLPTLTNILLSELEHHPSSQQSLVVFPTTRSLMYFYSRFKTGLDSRGLLGSRLQVHALHGRMLDQKRQAITSKFADCSLDEPGAKILFSTDVAARGLDFPSLSLVCQVGFSGVEDPVSQFVHRSGRTARGSSTGKNILLLGNGIDAHSKWVPQTLARIGCPPVESRTKIDSLDFDLSKHEVTGYHKLLSTKCLESLLSWFVERRSMLGLGAAVPGNAQSAELNRKANLIKALIDMVRSGGVPEPMISEKLAKKLKIDDIPGLNLSKFR